MSRILVTRLNSFKISVKAKSDYREAGSVEPVLRCLQAGIGFIHLAPIGSGQLEVADLKRFNELPGTLRSIVDAPDVKAFWLVTHWKDRCLIDRCSEHPLDGNAPPSDLPADTLNAVAYSWLFMQVSTIPDPAWHLASKLLSEASGQAAICRCGGEASVSVHAGSDHRYLTYTSTEELLQAIAVNAMPVSLGFGASRCSMSGLEPIIGPPALYAAVPHANSSRMMFAYRGLYQGGE